MNNIFIREINSFDWKLVSRIEKLEKRNLGSEASINRWVIPAIIRYGKFIVAKKGENDAEIIGVCELLRDWKLNDRVFLLTFYIDKDYRNKGIGKRLLGKSLDILRDKNFRQIELTVDPGNESAVSLYKEFGFKRIAIRKNEYGKGINRDLMRLEL